MPDPDAPTEECLDHNVASIIVKGTFVTQASSTSSSPSTSSSSTSPAETDANSDATYIPGYSYEKPLPRVEWSLGPGPHDEAVIAALTFAERAELIRAECMAERVAADGAPTVLHHDRPVNEVRSDKIFEGGWQKVSMAVDSGAAETVIPYSLVTGYPIFESDASRAGVNYASATGQPIPNLGEQRLPLWTSEGSLRSMTFQAAPVSRPLGSVKRMAASGHRVVFDDDGSYIENKVTGEINWLREEKGNYMLDFWIMPQETLNELQEWGFHGHP